MNNEDRVIKISDFSIPELDVFGRFSEPQLLHYNEPEPGIFLAETITVIERALDAGYEPVSFLMDQKLIDGQADELLARCPDTPVYTAELEQIVRFLGYALPRGILCAMKRKKPAEPASVLASAKRIVVLEKVTNPTNVGAIFRSAAALGMDAVLLSEDCTDPLYRRAVRVSVGTVFQIPWLQVRHGRRSGEDWRHAPKHAQPLIEWVREAGFYTAAMALEDNSRAVDDPLLKQQDKLALVLGSEGYGLLPDTIAACDCTVRIPMSHGVDSLNVAAASAVAFWEHGNRSGRLPADFGIY